MTVTQVGLTRSKGPGKPSKLAYLGHLLTENRNGLIMEIEVTAANGTAEREAELSMLDRFNETHERRPKTIGALGADAGYDAGEFLIDLESRCGTSCCDDENRTGRSDNGSQGSSTKVRGARSHA